MNTVVKQADVDAISQAADIIKAGGLVAFPTETVYGLGCNALDAVACAKVYAAKGRPSDNPLISHIAAAEQLSDLVADVPPNAKALMDKFWPGPLTIVFNAAAGGTIGVRMPRNPVALKLIQAAGVPVAAPSANTSGRPSPTRASHVLADLNGRVEMILDGGSCEHGLESTVIDCTAQPPVILRPGSITKEMIEELIGEVGLLTDVAGDTVPKAPGMKYKHYAPKATLTVVVGNRDDVAKEIVRLADSATGRVGIMATAQSVGLYEGRTTLNMGQTAEEIAAGLFGLLRKCDELGLDEVFVEGVAEDGLGAAIMNRLKKAAAHRVRKVPPTRN